MTEWLCGPLVRSSVPPFLGLWGSALSQPMEEAGRFLGEGNDHEVIEVVGRKEHGRVAGIQQGQHHVGERLVGACSHHHVHLHTTPWSGYRGCSRDEILRLHRMGIDPMQTVNETESGSGQCTENIVDKKQ